MGGAERRLSRALLLGLAVVALLASARWALHEPPAPNADRYDYTGRAWMMAQGEGARPFLVYPLRYAFDGADRFPPSNLSRPPLWPALLVPFVGQGLGDRAGVVLAAAWLLGLLLLVDLVGNRSFGHGAGAAAALAVASSFAVVRVLWGGGPELPLALLLYLLWTWSPGSLGRAGYALCGFLYGLMPLLHPVGWLYALLGLLARGHRYSRPGLAVLLAVGLAVALPWYLHAAWTAGTLAMPLQAQAELAKSLLDPGGMGPYRGLDPAPGLAVLASEPGLALRTMLARLWHHLLHLDGLLAWPFVLLALAGAARDLPLFGRDLLVVGAGAVALALFSPEWRLLVPFVAVLATWSGAGMVGLVERFPRVPWPPAFALLALLPWVLPMGQALRPGEELAGMPMAWRDPPAAHARSVARIEPAGAPWATDSAVLAWRALRPAMVLPDQPSTLARLRERPHLEALRHLALTRGRGALSGGAWDSLFAASTLVEEGEDGFQLWRLEDPRTAATEPPPLPSLAPEDGPDSLLALPVPPAVREGIRLQPDAARALLAMVEAAREEAGLELRVVSGHRSYARQEQLYRSAVERHGPDQPWVAAPGRSEHQLGLAADLADGAMQQVLEVGFGDTPEGRWLRENCRRFGFRISYTPDTVEGTGIRPEPWHVRWLGPPPPEAP